MPGRDRTAGTGRPKAGQKPEPKQDKSRNRAEPQKRDKKGDDPRASPFYCQLVRTPNLRLFRFLHIFGYPTTPNIMTAAPETRRFHLSLRRILPLLAGCFLFVGAGAWMILHASAAPSLAARYIIPVAGWLSILFFGTGAVALTVALPLRKRFPLVEVLPEGLKLHSILKPAKEYFFPWESIEAFSRVRIAGNDLLAVHTRDLAQRYDRSGPIGQIAIDISLSCSDTPYTINDRVLDAAPGEVERSLEEHLAAYRTRSEREPAS